MKYDPALDGLRGFAVAAVVIYHAAQTLLPGGWMGVEVFFVLSGFLITNLLVAELDATGRIDLRTFYMRRLLRLAPAFALLVVAVLFLVPFQRRAIGPSLVEALAAATYTMNWFRAFEWGADDALGHSWSLAMESNSTSPGPSLSPSCPGRAAFP